MSRNVYITGISGQIGSHLGRYLRQRGYFVTGADISSPQTDACDEFHRLDIVRDENKLAESLGGRDYGSVIHLAAIVAPTDEPAEHIFAVNVLGTYNVMRSAMAAASPRFICMSSESVLGFAFSNLQLKPAFVPINEEHALRAVDPYGLSKLLAERIAAAYHEVTHAATFSLRPPWVWIPEKYDRYLELVKDPARWAHGLWAYIVIDDLCSAVERAILCDVGGYHALFLTADDQGTPRSSHQLLDEYYGFKGPYEDGFPDEASVISSKAAKSLLGWKPRWKWRSWLEQLRPKQPQGAAQATSFRSTSS